MACILLWSSQQSSTEEERAEINGTKVLQLKECYFHSLGKTKQNKTKTPASLKQTLLLEYFNLFFECYQRCSCGFTFTWWGCCGLCLWHKPAELAHSFYPVLVSVSAFMTLSTVFHSINSPDNAPLSHSVLPLLYMPYWSFQLYSLKEMSPAALI